MCISPRHIQVKRATISDGCLVRVAVPCGKCYQCRKKKQNDYYLGEGNLRECYEEGYSGKQHYSSSPNRDARNRAEERQSTSLSHLRSKRNDNLKK